MFCKTVIISAPSGAGKSTIVRNLLSRSVRLEFSISATTRKPRGNEKNGQEYYFIELQKFREKIENDEFIEWEEVYKDHIYGTLKTEIKRIRSNGNAILFDVDVKGGIHLKQIFGKEAVSIFIMPPSTEVLEKRLKLRQTDSAEDIKIRIAKAEEELGLASKFDHIVINDVLEKAEDEVYNIVKEFLDRP